MQCDEGNHAPGARTTILVPLTTQGRAFSFHVPVPKGLDTGLREASWANCTQIFTVDRARLKTRLGAVPAGALQAIGEALLETLALAAVWARAPLRLLVPRTALSTTGLSTVLESPG